MARGHLPFLLCPLPWLRHPGVRLSGPAAATCTRLVLPQPQPIAHRPTVDSRKIVPTLQAIDGNDKPPSPPPEGSFPSSAPPAPPFADGSSASPAVPRSPAVTETSQGPVTVACVAAFGGSDSAWARQPKKALAPSVFYRSSRTWPRTFGARPRRISLQRMFSDSREKSSSESVANSTSCSRYLRSTYYVVLVILEELL